MSRQMGRILSSTKASAKVEFTEDALEGMLVMVNKKEGGILARVERLESKRWDGLIGYVYFLEPLDRPLRSMAPVWSAEDELEEGLLHVGTDEKNLEIRIGINPLFHHLVVAGQPQKGKTHLLIVLVEELLPHKVPTFIVDTQGEFVNLPEVSSDVVVVEDIRIEDLVGHLQQRKTVILNLLGLAKKAKVSRVGEILRELFHEKEKDYLKANNDSRLLELPPTLVVIDEVELYAPNLRSRKIAGVPTDALQPITDVAKRGTKLGLGLIIAPQRVQEVDINVRSACSSAAIFKVIDPGSIYAVSNMDYITSRDLSRIPTFEKGQCLIAGQMVKRARVILVRDIVTRRAKDTNFEEILGIQQPEADPHVPVIVLKDGNIVNLATEEVVETAIDRLAGEDLAAVEATEGDGVVLRDHLSTEEERLLTEIYRRKGDER